MFTTAGEVEKPQHGSRSDILVLLEQSAERFLPSSIANVSVLRPKEVLAPDAMRVHPAYVDKILCAHCLACIKLCPSLSWEYSKGQVVVNEVSCKGCGICGSVCPAGAISQRQFSMGMMLDFIDHLWEEYEDNGQDVESCSRCPIDALSITNIDSPEIHGSSVRLLCSGRIEPIHVIESSQMGVKGILLIDCFHNVREKDRFEFASKRLEQGMKLLKTLGIKEFRMETVKINSNTMSELPAALKKFTNGGSLASRRTGE